MEARSIPDAPALPWEASFAQYVEELLLPLLPHEDVVCAFHCELMKYVCDRDPLFIVRYVKDLERGEIVRTDHRARLLPSDNAPAWWWHMKMFRGEAVSTENFAEFVRTTPTHFFQVARYRTVARAGWHVAHILSAKDGNVNWRSWTRADAAWRFVRNVHPLNLFYVPGTKAVKVGGCPKLIGYVASEYATRWPSVWEEFTAVAGQPTLRPDAGNEILRVGQMTAPPPAASSDADGILQVHQWESTRLTFYRHQIEPLGSLGRFRIVTPHGTFEMTKNDFCSVFSNVVRSSSYLDHGYYNYPSVPKKALPFLV